ncbi:hypothetical protein AM233_14065 [Bacillus sp. FJAT-22058]|nr:hypothetical protein AM233_14065 [Bacillus sp. FJAT-22058]
MYEKTILTTRLIEALQAFLITEVSVDKTLIHGREFLPEEVINPELQERGKSSDFRICILSQYKHINDYLKIGRRAVKSRWP